jgi:dihydroorotate dehydrogenase electron transfer subunit
MAQQRQLLIADQRSVTPRLRWLTITAPELAHSARAGQYVLVRCAEEGSYDPLLRRPLFVAATEPALGQIGLLYTPIERGLAWLSRGRPGDAVDTIGPLGHPFMIDASTRNLLLIGQGPGLAALLLLARKAVARGCSVTILAGAADAGDLPPPFLLPGEVEYQSTEGRVTDLLALTGPNPISWADQICAALPSDQLPPLQEAIRSVRYRWKRGFASVLLEGPIVCGVGACGVCMVRLRRGTRMLCHDGPVFDVRDL